MVTPAGAVTSTLISAGIVHPDAVFDDFGLESGLAEFLGDVVGGGLVLGSAGHVRGLGQNAQVFFGELRIGNNHESNLSRHFIGRVAEPKQRSRTGRHRGP